ncbi:MAG: UDP-N-acetylglucosamine 4-epimerase [Gemmatimonadaceae bacterium]|nr:UDP-N-acetylglucosamine 4-epimerase [Gemmatimonadaceae bacterium]
MKALLTGGAGFIGSHLTRRLLELGWDVRVVDNLSTGFIRNLADVLSSVEFRQEDLRDPSVSERAVEGVEVVFHLAAMSSVPRSMVDPLGTHESNVNATFSLLDAARRHGVRRFVYSASSSAYGETPVLPKAEDAEPLPKSPYAASKLAGEMYTLAYARAELVEGVALRYFNVFGPRQDPNGPYAAVIPLVMRAASAGTPMTIYGDGLQTRDFTYIDNVVQANVLAATGDASRVSGFAVNVGAGEQISLLDLIAMVEEVSGRSIQVRHQPPRPGDIRDSLASLERARSVLGYAPLVSVGEGVRRLWHWTAGHEPALAAG